MRKIPTLFVRSEDRRSLLPEVTPGCEWALTDEGGRWATRKYDGTCVMFDGVQWWARREIKPFGVEPKGFLAVHHDKVTGKTQGWEPIEGSSWLKPWREAADRLVCDLPVDVDRPPTGTYELCGPKINGNPEKFDGHRLIEHATAHRIDLVGVPMFHTKGEYALRAATDLLVSLHEHGGWEGLVWHHPDGRMAKLKFRDVAQ